MADETIQFSIKNENDEEMKKILLEVYNALNEKGYNSVSQIVGYILSEDPTYITTHNNARSLVRKLDRDELLQSMVEDYLGIKKIKCNYNPIGVTLSGGEQEASHVQGQAPCQKRQHALLRIHG